MSAVHPARIPGTMRRVGEDLEGRWRDTRPAVADAVPLIVAALASHGVTGVKWFLAFHGYPVVWLVTATDAQKLEVLKHGSFQAEVQSLLADARVSPDLVEQAVVTAESQETVDRNWDGNWWHAMK